MAVTINVNGLSLVHQGSDGVATATLPDVCKTPAPPAPPVPTPYPNIARSSSLSNGSTTVLVDGGNPAAVTGSEFCVSAGDEAGTVGGIKSSTVKMEATWLTYSSNVRFEGRNVCRLTDKMLMNHGNTACLGGVVQQPVAGQSSVAQLRSKAREEEEGEVHVRLPIDPRKTPGSNDRFVLSSDDPPYKQTKTIKDDQVPGDEFVDLIFTGLKARSQYTLHIERDEGKPYTVFERVPFARLSRLARPVTEAVDVDEAPGTRRRRRWEDVLIEEEADEE